MKTVKAARLFMVLSLIVIAPQCYGQAISQSNWKLLFVDSQETVAHNYSATNSFDGNPTTFWHTAYSSGSVPYPHEIQVDLGAFYNITTFSYLPRQDGCSNGWVKQYEFYVSSDGSNWGSAVATGSFNYGTAVATCPGASILPAFNVAVSSIAARYIRFRALSEVNGNPWASMAEINVTGTASTTPAVSSVNINPATVTGGGTSQGTVTLTAPAPSGGEVVTLTSSNSMTATAPATVTVLGGSSSANFTVTANLVPVSTSSTIFATGGGATQTANVTVQNASNWSEQFVDSQEVSCHNDAGVNSFDGNSNTIWHTQYCGGTPGLPHEIQINLGALFNLTGFNYLPRQDGCSNGWINQYNFYVSSDGSNWTTVVSNGTFNYGSAVKSCPGASVPGPLLVSFGSIAAQYIRLQALSEVTNRSII